MHHPGRGLERGVEDQRQHRPDAKQAKGGGRPVQRRGEQCKYGRQPDISRRAAVPCAAALCGWHTRFCVPDHWHIAGLFDCLVQQWFAGDGHAHGAKQYAQRITMTREKVGARGQHQRASASIAQW